MAVRGCGACLAGEITFLIFERGFFLLGSFKKMEPLNMWSCAKNRKYLNAYIDDELPERTRRKVEHHLSGCPVCLLEFDRLCGLAPLLVGYEAPPVPAGLSSRILAEAAVWRKRKGAQKTFGLMWLEFLFRPWLVRASTTAALAVGLAIGALMGWASYVRPDSGQWVDMETDKNVVRNMYAFDVLGSEPLGSIEAATMALMDEERIK